MLEEAFPSVRQTTGRQKPMAIRRILPECRKAMQRILADNGTASFEQVDNVVGPPDDDEEEEEDVSQCGQTLNKHYLDIYLGPRRLLFSAF